MYAFRELCAATGCGLVLMVLLTPRFLFHLFSVYFLIFFILRYLLLASFSSSFDAPLAVLLLERLNFSPTPGQAAFITIHPPAFCLASLTKAARRARLPSRCKLLSFLTPAARTAIFCANYSPRAPSSFTVICCTRGLINTRTPTTVPCPTDLYNLRFSFRARVLVRPTSLCTASSPFISPSYCPASSTAS